MPIAAHIRSVSRLIRPGNLVVAAAGTTAGAILSDGLSILRDPDEYLVFAATVTVLVAAGANALNDACDVEADGINRPERPLPSGSVTRRVAVGLFVVLSVAALVISWILSVEHFFVCSAVVLGLVLYNVRLKHVALVGNLIVAASVAATLLFGAIANGIVVDVYVGAAFAFLTTLARELVKDLEDMTGDAVVGSRSLPLLAGESASRWIAVVVVVLTAGLVPMPFIWWGFSGLYLLVSAASAACLLIAVGVLSRIHPGASLPGENGYSRTSTLLKVAMVFGLVALLVARVSD